MDGAVEIEVMNERSAFRIFHDIPFSLQQEKVSRLIDNADRTRVISEEISPISRKLERQLSDRSKSDSEHSEDFTRDDDVVSASESRLPDEIPPTEVKDRIPVSRPPNEFEQMPLWMAIKVYFAWAILVVFSRLRDYLTRMGVESEKGTKELPQQKDFVPLYTDFEAFYQRRMYMRIRDCFERPICGVPGATVDLLNRESTDGNWNFRFTGTRSRVTNVSSYNYLGFAQTEGPCATEALSSIEQNGLSLSSTTHERGTSMLQHKLENLVSEFLGVESAICFSMGFATNSMNVAALADKNTLIISDQRNHASLILGIRLSGASAKVFKHNDMRDLDRVLFEAVSRGNPKTRKPYSKIIIIVEGIYSMEGSICNLPEIIELKKKYKAYLYLDEAHSIGAMGRTGRGVVEYWNCDPNDVDILMGTFTKSFGASGGYIAGTKNLINHLRITSPTGFYSAPMSPPVVQQIISSMSIIMGLDGKTEGADRIERLARNARYFRAKLKQGGFVLYGSDDSPVVPLLIYYPALCGFYSRELLKRGIGAVVVSYPATEMTEARVRFCISAAHTKQQIDEVLEALFEVGDLASTRYSTKNMNLLKDATITW